jgi:hypothetical protein
MFFLVDESGKKAKGYLFVFFSPALRSLWAAVFRPVFARVQRKLQKPGRLPLFSMGFFNHASFFRKP